MRNADDALENEALIAGENEYEQRTQGQSRNGGVDEISENDIKTPGRVIWLLTLAAGLSGLLFGYDTGVISSTLVSIGSDLNNRPLTTLDKSLITSVTSLTALIASPLTGWLADKYGRKAVICGADVLFVAGALLQAFSVSVWMMVLGRAIVGLAVGSASCAVPLYITELAPAPFRGRLVTIQSLFITGGQVVAYLVGWTCSDIVHGWAYMVGSGALPAIVQLCMMKMMPETPRWLLQNGCEGKARAILSAVYSVNSGREDHTERAPLVEAVLERVQAEIAEESKIRSYDEEGDTIRKRGVRDHFGELIKEPGNRRALIIACMLQGFQQLCGFNSLMYFSATIFALVGFTSPIGTSLSIALTNFGFTLVAFAYIDTVGRRRILLRSVPFMIISLLLAAIAFHFIGTRETSSPYDLYYAKSSPWPTVLLLAMIGYVAAYAIGLGCVPWQQSELFPLSVRSVGSGVATATNWSSNFVIGITFLPMMEFLGPSVTFALYAAVCVACWASIWRIYPETSGLELEGIAVLLQNGWGVEASMEGFEERRRLRAEAKALEWE